MLAEARSQSQRLKHSPTDREGLPASDGGHSNSSGSSNSSNSSIRGAGYARHEIEGIGGVVKRKLVKMVKVGACVPDEVGGGVGGLGGGVEGGAARCHGYSAAAADERDTTITTNSLGANRRYEKLLRSEAEGRVRSLCGWCSGFILSHKEVAAAAAANREAEQNKDVRM